MKIIELLGSFLLFRISMGVFGYLKIVELFGVNGMLWHLGMWDFMSLWCVYVRVKSCISFFMFSFFYFLSLTNKRDFLGLVWCFYWCIAFWVVNKGPTSHPQSFHFYGFRELIGKQPCTDLFFPPKNTWERLVSKLELATCSWKALGIDL